MEGLYGVFESWGVLYHRQHLYPLAVFCVQFTFIFHEQSHLIDRQKNHLISDITFHDLTKECRSIVREEALYLTMLSAVTPTL